jgi:hypothetical protein
MMTVTLVNPQHDLSTPPLIAPPPFGYLLLAATVAPPKGPPIVRADSKRSALLRRVSEHLGQVSRLDGVVRTTGYRAIVIPPARPPDFRPDLRPPRFDVTVLVETDMPGRLSQIATASPVASLRTLLHDEALVVKEMHARCVKAIADVDKGPDGTYLFNYWAAADAPTALEVFDHLAPWFQRKTGLQNSTVLQSLGDDEFAFVNHARWDAGALSVVARQLRRPSFHRFVRPTLAANHIEVYPALYRRL